jgi:outer membrane protein assembly factor BamA
MMKMALRVLIVLLFAAINGANSEVLKPDTALVFHGATAFSPSELIVLYRPSDPNALSGAAAVLQAYHRKGFFDCALSPSPRSDTLFVNVTEGPPARWTRVTFAGNAKLPADTLLSEGEFRPGDFFSQDRVDALIEALLVCYERRGFPFCEIRVEDVRRDSAGVAVTLRIEENLKVYFGKVLLPKALKTRPYVMDRLLRIQESMPFDQRVLDAAQDRLERSGLFESIGPFTLRIKPGERLAEVVVDAREGAISSAEGVLGYQPKGNGQGGLSGYVNLNLKNIAGTFRALSLHYLKESPLTSTELYYSEPWILKSKMDGEFFFNFRIEEGSYTSLETKLQLAFPISDRLRAYSGLSRTSMTFTSISGADTILVSENTVGSHVGIILDFRDFPENPRKGLYLNLPLALGIKSGAQGRNNEVRPEITLETYVNPRGAHVLAHRLHYATLITGDTSLHRAELLPLGGAAGLRGYREAQFRGKTVLSLRNEYRYLFGKRGRGILFLDIGAIDPGSPYFRNSLRWDALLFGYGAGLFMRTPAGYAGVDYGLGRGDGFMSGKLHLVLRNTF